MAAVHARNTGANPQSRSLGQPRPAQRGRLGSIFAVSGPMSRRSALRLRANSGHLNCGVYAGSPDGLVLIHINAGEGHQIIIRIGPSPPSFERPSGGVMKHAGTPGPKTPVGGHRWGRV